MTSNEETTAGSDTETFEEYSARMKAQFPPAKVYEKTRDLPATGRYTRVTHERHLTPEEAADLGMSAGPSTAELFKAAISEEPDIVIHGSLDDYFRSSGNFDDRLREAVSRKQDVLEVGAIKARD